ncbi:hypothetical protein ES705_45686 [subsurface metagenome]
MIHWAFLIPAFLLGLILGWIAFYRVGLLLTKIEEAMQAGATGFRL